MRFTLPDGVSYCDAGDRLVFLDIKRDRYVALAADAEASFRRAVADESLTAEEARTLEELISNGLLQRSAGGPRLTPCAAPACAEGSLIDGSRSASPARVAHALWRLLHARITCGLRPLERTIGNLAQRKAAPPVRRIAPSLGVMEEVAAAFSSTALLAAPLDRCLPRSVAVAHMLLDLGIKPDFVIAVRLQPFSAHCWVQHGATLINETSDRAQTYTAILVV